MIRRVRFEWNIRKNFIFLSVLTFAGEIITTEDNTPLDGGSTPADWYKSWKPERLQKKIY